MEDFTFSNHAMHRYAERIKEYDSTHDVEKFIVEHENLIKDGIKKLIEFSDKIYTGKSTVKSNNGLIDVYLHKDGWVVIVDSRSKNVVTLYRITAGFDAELDKLVVQRVFDNLAVIQKERQEKLSAIEEQEKYFNSIIEENEAQIRDLRTKLKNLEELNKGYSEVVTNMAIERANADEKLRELIMKAINKKVL